MSNFLNNRKFASIGGAVIGVAAAVGIGCLAYRKIKQIMQPRMLCCRCITDEEIDALLNQMSDYEDFSEDFYEDWSEDDYE